MKKTIENILEDFGQIHEEYCELNQEGGSDYGCSCAVKSMVTEICNKIKADLLAIADTGEYEDIRREVEEYFKF